MLLGKADGIKVKNNLTVYTELPSQDNIRRNLGTVLEYLLLGVAGREIHPV